MDGSYATLLSCYGCRRGQNRPKETPWWKKNVFAHVYGSTTSANFHSTILVVEKLKILRAIIFTRNSNKRGGDGRLEFTKSITSLDSKSTLDVNENILNRFSVLFYVGQVPYLKIDKNDLAMLMWLVSNEPVLFFQYK